MSITIVGKLNKAASTFSAGESTGFGIRLGVQYYSHETKQKEWANYECAIFAKAQGQIDFYGSVLVEGSVIEVSAPSCYPSAYDGSNGQVLSIKLVDARLGYVYTPEGSQTVQQPSGGGQQPYQKQASQQQASQNFQQPDDFDDDIPF